MESKAKDKERDKENKQGKQNKYSFLLNIVEGIPMGISKSYVITLIILLVVASIVAVPFYNTLRDINFAVVEEVIPPVGKIINADSSELAELRLVIEQLESQVLENEAHVKNVERLLEEDKADLVETNTRLYNLQTELLRLLSLQLQE
jgi:hypothetical protein